MSATANETPPLIALEDLREKTEPWKLDPFGDVMLIVGKEKICKIIVSASVLSIVSSVFRAMFTGSFKEGGDLKQAHASGQPMDLELPEDDPEGMFLFCSFVHFNMSRYSFLFTNASNLHKIAIVSDKYDCNRALGPPIKPFLDTADTTSGVVAIRELVMASYFFDCGVVFTALTKALIVRDTTAFSAMATASPLDLRLIGVPVPDV